MISHVMCQARNAYITYTFSLSLLWFIIYGGMGMEEVTCGLPNQEPHPHTPACMFGICAIHVTGLITFVHMGN